MNPYLVTATDAKGRRDSFTREATSLQHLRAQLERDGYSDIEFLDDDFSAQLRRHHPTDPQAASPSALRLEAKLRKGPARGAVWLQAARNNALLLFVNAALIAYGSWSGRYRWVLIGTAVILWWAWRVWKGGAKADRYQELVRAQARGDREQARSLIDALSADPSLAGNELLQSDLKFRAASLRASGGDLDGALAAVEPMRSMASLANGGFEGRVASIQYYAGDMQAYLASMEAGYEASERGPSKMLDLAFGHARVGNAARARELLDGLDRRNLPLMHLPLVFAAEGLLLQASGQEQAGLEKLREAADASQTQTEKAAFWGFHGIILSRFVLALLRAGRRDEALARFEPWRDVVLNTTDPETRRALQAELGT